jgi:hypothetical protein
MLAAPLSRDASELPSRRATAPGFRLAPKMPARCPAADVGSRASGGTARLPLDASCRQRARVLGLSWQERKPKLRFRQGGTP